MSDTNSAGTTFKIQSTGTVVNCNEQGHCPHPGTAVGSWYCCKCGQYLGINVAFTFAPTKKEMTLGD